MLFEGKVTFFITLAAAVVLVPLKADAQVLLNGNFESGNMGFTSEYGYSPGDIWPEGTYDILSDPSHAHSLAASYGDHTTGSGLMMAVNGATVAGKTVWSAATTIRPHSSYSFKVWISSWLAPSPAELEVRFNGISAGTFDAPTTTGVWQEFTATWDSNEAASLVIEIRDLNTEPVGNDFALDDLSLSMVGGDGTIVAWGDNEYGQCDVPDPHSVFVAVAGCWGHSLGLKADGSVVAWGSNDSGECDVPEPNADYVAISGGGWYSCGLKDDGTIVVWGGCPYDVCNVPEPNSGFTMISGGWSHILGLKADSSIVAWGENAHGECYVPEPNGGFVAVASGGAQSYGLKADGSIVLWGYDGGGAYHVPQPNADFIAVAAGASHGLGLKADGSIVAWGDNYYHQCNVPEPNSDFVAVSGGAYHSLGLKADGTIVAWGRNEEGECNVPGPNTGAWISAGAYHSVALSLTGACCLISYCLPCTEPICAGYGGSYQGTGTVCDPNPCPTSSVAGGSQIPPRLALSATPNPSAGQVRIAFGLPRAMAVTIEVFNAAGSFVRRLPEGQLAAGQHAIEWDGRNDRGSALPSGVYLARIVTGEGSTSGRVVLTR